MDRTEILARLRAFPYDREDYWVITGGAMVLYGIREQTHDIDLGCSAGMADALERDGYLYRQMSNGKRWFRYGDAIEVFEEWISDGTEKMEGFRVLSLKGLLEMKQELGREKDLRDIELIREHLKRVEGEGRKYNILPDQWDPSSSDLYQEGYGSFGKESLYEGFGADEVVQDAGDGAAGGVPDGARQLCGSRRGIR